jgi:hypothetical protein
LDHDRFFKRRNVVDRRAWQERIPPMNRMILTTLALGWLVAANVPARADQISWGFDWDRSPVAVLAGTGGVSFTNEPNGFARGNSDVVATNLKVFSSATSANPDVFGPNAGKYSLTLTLTDMASGKVGVLTFTGQLQGHFTKGNAEVTNHFTGPRTQVLQLGTHLFFVTMVSYSPPGPPLQANAGSITVHITASPECQCVAPEPSSLLLGFVGLTFVGGAVLRARRKPSAAN